MDIINKLKRGKKEESVFDSLIKKKETKEESGTKPVDMEVTAITPDKPVSESVSAKPANVPKREFRTEGMQEFDIESLGVDSGASLKIEYKAKIMSSIDENRFEEAIELIKQLQEKLRGT
uniref:Uncharacterized protein n=1 Tax=candidate division WOR-3 bacterium TaxID=2052148 RepID=A0A7C4TAV6_UNCW3